MFENIEQPSESDLQWAEKARCIGDGFLYLVFVFQSFMFCLLFYLIHWKTPTQMAEYRRLLQVNVITAYLTEISFIFWMPTILPTNYHIISDGVVGQFGKSANYFWFFVVGTFVSSHFVAILGCVFYQITIIWPIKKHNVRVVLEFLLANDVRFHVIFISLTISIFCSTSYYIFYKIKVDFEPAKHMDMSVPQDRILYTNYLQGSNNAIYIDFSQIGILLILFTLSLISFIGAIIFGIVYYCLWSKRSTAALKKTQQLQRSLHLCILMQTISLTVFYMLPLELLISTKILQMPYAFTIIQLAVISIMIYSPVNHSILIFFVRHFRTETRKLIRSVHFGRSSSTTILVRERNEIRTLSFGT